MIIKIIEEHDVSKSYLCERLGINRSLLYRYLSHKSIMPRDAVELFKREFMLSPVEIATLENAYEALLVGPDRYQCRLLIHEMMNSAPGIERYINRPYIMDREYIASVTSNQLSVIHGHDTIKMLLHYILSKVGQSDKTDKIFVTIQPDNCMVMNELIALLRNKQNNYAIYHTFKLYRNETLNMTTPLAANLSLLKKVLMQIIPIDTNTRYHAAYHYEQYMGNNPTQFADSARIVTKDFALLILPDFEQAMLITEPETIELYFKQLGHFYGQSLPLTQTIDLTKKSSAALLKKVNLHGEVNIFPEPVFFFARAALFAENKQNLPGTLDNDFLKSKREKSIKSIQNGKPAYCYFSVDGLHKFVNTGLFSDMNERLMMPLSGKQMKQYLGELLHYAVKYENVVPLLLENDTLGFLNNIFVRIYHDTEIWLAFKDSGPNALVSLSENSIVKGFSDYFFNVLPQKLMPDCKKDAIQAIQAAMDRIPT